MRPSEWLLVALSTMKSQTNTLTGKQQREGGDQKTKQAFLSSKHGEDDLTSQEDHQTSFPGPICP